MADPVQHVVEKTVLEATKAIEEQLDAELDRLDNLDSDDLERLREKRLQQMKQQASPPVYRPLPSTMQLRSKVTYLSSYIIEMSLIIMYVTPMSSYLTPTQRHFLLN